MGTTEILASLGALAWIPQLAQWGYNYFTKPTIRIIPDKTAQIGYTTFGPIFNLRLSIDVCYKDTILDFIGLQLIHEDGSCYNFEWVGMNEIFSEVITTDGSSPVANQIVQKDVTPIAIKLSTLSLSEKFFRFQQKEFISENRIKSDSFYKSLSTAKKMKLEGKNIDYVWKKLEDYQSFFNEKFIWKAGKYTVKFKISSPAKFNFIQIKTEFTLDQNQIDTLKLNLANYKFVKENLENLLENNEERNKIEWAWVSPEIRKDV